MTYAYPTINDTKGFQEMSGYINTVSGGIFFPLTLLALYIIIFVSTLAFGAGRAFTYASFVSAILSMFLVFAGLLNPMFMYFLFVLTGIGFIVMRLGKGFGYPQI